MFTANTEYVKVPVPGNAFREPCWVDSAAVKYALGAAVAFAKLKLPLRLSPCSREACEDAVLSASEGESMPEQDETASKKINTAAGDNNTEINLFLMAKLPLAKNSVLSLYYLYSIL